MARVWERRLCFRAAMGEKEPQKYPRRIYPLDPRKLTAEQIAVTFAMTSRRPEPFDEIAEQVSQEKAADFHERWVVGYGHASVAEHAVLHLAVENISRLACDSLEDNRLASYIEKSSRYQVIPRDCWHFPRELAGETALAELYRDTCAGLFQDYCRFIDGCLTLLKQRHPPGERERESAYNLRLRRIATDSCRLALPSATLTNVGVTANARVLEHAISKLMSSELVEEQELGHELREEGRAISPTLIKYAVENAYLKDLPLIQRDLTKGTFSGNDTGEAAPTVRVRLVQWEKDSTPKLAAALLYPRSHLSHGETLQRVAAMPCQEQQAIIDRCVAGLGPHDAPPRAFELADFTFEFTMDYGAYREFKRHRMQSYLPQQLTVAHGYRTPELLVEAGLQGEFDQAMERVSSAFRQAYQFSPVVSQYLVTHAHYCRVLSKMNLRECFHLFKLRTSSLAHFSIREPIAQAMKLAVEAHPQLFKHLHLRDYPDWWPHSIASKGGPGSV